MSTSPKIVTFSPSMVRPFRYEAFYEAGRKMWQASCQFDVRLMLDTKLEPVERAVIEYRQFIRGGVWVREGSTPWTSDDQPNGNAAFKIPAYDGLGSDIGIPTGRVSGEGLSLHWKEDGKILGSKKYRFGYRDNATFNEPDEKDLWQPKADQGHLYLARDTPAIKGRWNGETIRVWIELHFRGYVVEIDRGSDDKTFPAKVLARKDWTCFWRDEQALELWGNATRVPDR